MIDYNDGKVYGWNSGECPVHPQSVVRYWLREGVVGTDLALKLGWEWEDSFAEYDIIAFQVLKQYVEPKTIWVNEYQSGTLAYDTKEEADKNAGYSVIRKAVKYVEVQD